MLKKTSRLQGELFKTKTHLTQIVTPSHPLCRLAAIIEWSEFDAAFGKLYCPDQGRPHNSGDTILNYWAPLPSLQPLQF